MKTVQEYLNDPHILNDPDMAEAIDPVKELHAIQLKIQDENADMSLTERIESLNKEVEAFLVPMGKSLCYDLSGQGKLESRMMLVQ